MVVLVTVPLFYRMYYCIFNLTARRCICFRGTFVRSINFCYFIHYCKNGVVWRSGRRLAEHDVRYFTDWRAAAPMYGHPGTVSGQNLYGIEAKTSLSGAGNRERTDMKAIADQQFVRFLIVGAVNTGVGSIIMFGLYNFAHVPYWISSFSNYFLTSILSFFLNKHFTFQNTEKNSLQVIRFAVNIAVCYLLAYGIERPVCRYFLSNAEIQIRDNVSMLAGMVLFTFLNFWGQKLFTFRSTGS